MTTPSSPFPPLPWQDDKRLRSGDRVWFLTDIQTSHSTFYNWSVPQQWHRVGGLDLTTMKLGYFAFTSDDVRAMMRSGLEPAPWKDPLPIGVELVRSYHGPKKEGRFRESVTLIELDPELAARGPDVRRYFERQLQFRGNSEPGMWNEIEAWAARENKMEAAALSMQIWFSASDLKEVLGEPMKVGPVLARLVKEERLLSNGKKTRGARYLVVPPRIVERADWTG